MMYIWLSAVLFGMVHPGSKVFLSSGLPLDLFCLGYIGIRLVVQLPFVIRTKAYKIEKVSDLKIIAILGLIGASLQLSEFSGIAEGASVSTVTFLVYTHPFWSIILSKFIFKEELGVAGAIKLGFAAVGIFLIVGVENISLENLHEHWVSLFAGLIIACWIKISNVARKKGFSSLKTNFYYDFMSTICLLVFIVFQGTFENITVLGDYLSTPSQFLLLFGYSILIGLLPNLLFYKGSASVDSTTAGYVLLLEPVIAASTAWLVWNEQISLTFLIGAIFILAANFPVELFKNQLKWLAAPIGLILLTGASLAGEIKKITLLEIIPQDSSEYTVSYEKKQIEFAARLALSAVKVNASCPLELESNLEMGSEEYLVARVKALAKAPGERILLGISRTNFARVAAKAAKGTQIRAISVGASTSNLGTINPRFMTMVNPWEEQFVLIQKLLKDNNCTPEMTLGVFDPSHFLSQNFLRAYKKAKLGQWVSIGKREKIDFSRRCLFIGLNFADSATILKDVKGSELVIGTGDWNMSIVELDAIALKLARSITIHVPTGWRPDVNSNSRLFDQAFRKLTGEEPSPIAAYVYDGVLLSAHALCHKVDILKEAVNLPSMLRTYKDITPTGNLLSPMHVKTIRGMK